MFRSCSVFLSAAGLAAALLVSPLAHAQRGGTGRMQIPVQKSGKVVMEDGSPLPEPALIEASCGSGMAIPVARTDSKGGFIVGRGRDSDVDARIASGTGRSPNELAGCSLQARLPGYQSSVLRVVDNETFDLGTIVLKRPEGVEGTMHSATDSTAPKEAKKAVEKAQSAIEKKKWNEARPQLEKAVQLYPGYATAWFELGRVHHASGDLAQARSAFEKATTADPKFIKPQLQLTGVLYQERNWQGAADASAAVIKLDPYSFPAAFVLNAVSNLRLGKMQLAENSAKQAISLGSGQSFPEAEYTLAMALASRGDYKEAAQHLRIYIQLVPDSPAADALKKQLAELEKASGTAAEAQK